MPRIIHQLGPWFYSHTSVRFSFFFTNQKSLNFKSVRWINFHKYTIHKSFDIIYVLYLHQSLLRTPTHLNIYCLYLSFSFSFDNFHLVLTLHCCFSFRLFFTDFSRNGLENESISFYTMHVMLYILMICFFFNILQLNTLNDWLAVIRMVSVENMMFFMDLFLTMTPSAPCCQILIYFSTLVDIFSHTIWMMPSLESTK